MRPVKFILLIFLFNICSVFALYAQNANAVFELDSNRILVGQQITGKLRFSIPANYQSQWPVIPDTLNGIDFVNKGPIDTLKSPDQKILTREQKITLTAFDSGFYVITPFSFNYHKPGDTATYLAETQAQLLTVNLIPVDTTKAIRDIKGPIEVGISWQEIAMYVIIGLVFIALALLIIYLVRKRKVKPVEVKQEVVKRPAHEIALEKLHELQDAKLWQQGNIKQYYTGISDTVREYISNRWNIDAMERTTDEIMHSSFIQHVSNETYNRIKSVLTISDLAKFAKYTPVAPENEQAIADAFTFVEETKEQKVDINTLPAKEQSS